MPDYPLITLLTDFGISDPYVGIMKGIIADIAPKARVIDLTHMITPQNIREGALALDRAYPYFPAGTIHLAVIDPGVGTERHALAMRTDHYLFVGPDNGLFTFVIKRAKSSQKPIKVVRLENPRYRLEPVSPVFHGRDLFAPAAAYLAAGAALENFGDVIENPVVLTMPFPEAISNGYHGEIWAVDHFGSLETNMESGLLSGIDPKQIRIQVAGKVVDHWVRTFADGEPGELVALVNSSGRLCISIVNGSAANELNVGVGTPVDLIIHN
ncbi:MAG: SAM-dependent chlorinase/fluorinase [Leptolinea sp.]|nr:SAM-dependent chlorinase/fluorinase [Leptolinea sp.]